MSIRQPPIYVHGGPWGWGGGTVFPPPHELLHPCPTQKMSGFGRIEFLHATVLHPSAPSCMWVCSCSATVLTPELRPCWLG